MVLPPPLPSSDAPLLVPLINAAQGNEGQVGNIRKGDLFFWIVFYDVRGGGGGGGNNMTCPHNISSCRGINAKPLIVTWVITHHSTRGIGVFLNPLYGDRSETKYSLPLLLCCRSLCGRKGSPLELNKCKRQVVGYSPSSIGFALSSANSSCHRGCGGSCCCVVYPIISPLSFPCRLSAKM